MLLPGSGILCRLCFARIDRFKVRIDAAIVAERCIIPHDRMKKIALVAFCGMQCWVNALWPKDVVAFLRLSKLRVVLERDDEETARCVGCACKQAITGQFSLVAPAAGCSNGSLSGVGLKLGRTIAFKIKCLAHCATGLNVGGRRCKSDVGR